MPEREIIVYPKLRYGMRSKTEKWGVAKLPEKQRQKRLVLITGCGRSGTTSTAKMFQSIGLDVQHELTGQHGTASLFFTVDSDWHPMLPWYKGRNHVGERQSDYIFEHVLHITRHPLRTIPSIGAIFNGLNYEYFEENGLMPHCHKMPKLLRCAHTWYGLNMAAEAQAEFRFKLEAYEQAWPRIRKILGLGDVPWPGLPHVNRGTGYRATEPTTWGELMALDPTLTRNIIKMAKRYGYDAP